MSLPAPSSPDAVETLYTHHHHWLRRWLHGRLGGDRHCAEDLAHDTFLRLLNKEEALVAREPRALLTTVAKRVLSNYWRRRQLEQAWLEALAALPLEHHPSPEYQHLLFETLLEIDQQLDGLPVVVKRAFLLSQLNGLSHAEVAATLQISITTVKRYVMRGLQRCYFADVDFGTAHKAHRAS